MLAALALCPLVNRGSQRHRTQKGTTTANQPNQLVMLPSLILLDGRADLGSRGEADAGQGLKSFERLREGQHPRRGPSHEGVHAQTNHLLALLFGQLPDVVLNGLRVLAAVKVLGQNAGEVVGLHAIREAKRALAAFMCEVVRHVVIHEIQESFDARLHSNLRSTFRDREAGGEPCLGPRTQSLLKIVQGLFEVGLLLATAQLGSARRIVETVSSKLPARLLEGFGHMVQLSGLAVDHGSCWHPQLFEHGAKPLQTTTVAVVPPATVGHLRNGLKMWLDGRPTASWDKDLHIHHWNHEDLLASCPALFHLLPAHAAAVAFLAHQGHRHRGGHQSVPLDKRPGVRKLDGEVKVLRKSKFETIPMIHRYWLGHGCQRLDNLFRVDDEG
mmetsp:Transcript_54353/g.121578  ORF Transcript_54353/g.121578 Transcript_54353/m.121578 type:complete len:386 (-) Transcript_54353:512-1669(-)